MSNARRFRRAAERRGALAAARVQGCSCRPDIRHGHRDPDGVQHMNIAHDADCPMADAPSTLVAIFFDRGHR